MDDNTETLTPNKSRKSTSSKTKAAASTGNSTKATSARKATTTAKSAATATKTKPVAATKAAKSKVSLQRTEHGKQISSEQRYRMIETAAYYLAEKRGFNSNPEEDWLVAENQIDQQLNAHI